jgi:hypothetical protein
MTSAWVSRRVKSAEPWMHGRQPSMTQRCYLSPTAILSEKARDMSIHISAETKAQVDALARSRGISKAKLIELASMRLWVS